MRKIFSLCLLLLPSLLMAAGSKPYIKGTLPNGITYYLQRNTEMPGQANFALVHNIGADGHVCAVVSSRLVG